MPFEIGDKVRTKANDKIRIIASAGDYNGRTLYRLKNTSGDGVPFFWDDDELELVEKVNKEMDTHEFQPGDQVKWNYEAWPRITGFTRDAIYTVKSKAIDNGNIKYYFNETDQWLYGHNCILVKETNPQLSKTIYGYLVNVFKHQVREVELESAFLHPMIRKFLAEDSGVELTRDDIDSWDPTKDRLYYAKIDMGHHFYTDEFGRFSCNVLLIGRNGAERPLTTLDELKASITDFDYKDKTEYV